jgi:hypothetical protein
VRALDELLMFLDKANLTLTSSKTSIGTTSVQFVGHILDGNGASPDPDKVREIEAISLPQDAKALTTAMGSFGYYRRFIRGYAMRTNLLREYYRRFIRGYVKSTHLLREKAAAPWTSNADGTAMWTAEEEAQFFTIRDCLTQASILAHPDWSLPFEVHTEASREGLGAVLVQRQGGQEVAIGYASCPQFVDTGQRRVRGVMHLYAIRMGGPNLGAAILVILSRHHVIYRMMLSHPLSRGQPHLLYARSRATPPAFSAEAGRHLHNSI